MKDLPGETVFTHRSLGRAHTRPGRPGGLGPQRGLASFCVGEQCARSC